MKLFFLSATQEKWEKVKAERGNLEILYNVSKRILSKEPNGMISAGSKMVT